MIRRIHENQDEGAFTWASAHGLRTVALVGAKCGRLAEVADQVIVIDDGRVGRVEDVQMHILLMVCYAFLEQVA